MTTQKKKNPTIVSPAEKIKHLEFIQEAINRMGSNSFKIKTSAITFVSASILSSTQNSSYALASIPAVLIFWLLDSYYLQQERKFRGLYNDVAGLSNNTMGEIKLFEMPIHRYMDGKFSFSSVFMSITIMSLYLPIIFVLLFIYILIQTQKL